MIKPPVTLFHPTYVVSYATVDSEVKYMDRRNLNVGGEWLGEVPNLAICKDVNRSKYFLSHCNEEWESLCSVQEAETEQEIKETAEGYYLGIRSKWINTSYSSTEAKQIFRDQENKMRCSFCDNSLYDNYYQSLVQGKKANICNVCIQEFSEG